MTKKKNKKKKKRTTDRMRNVASSASEVAPPKTSPAAPDETPAPQGECSTQRPVADGRYTTIRMMAAVALVMAGLWSYLPTMGSLIEVWNSQPDYSHGFLVPLLSVWFLWLRRESFPVLYGGLAWPGLLLIAGSIGLRVAGAVAYIDPVDSWSMVLWIAGAVWFLGGWQLLKWALPAIGFLLFMIPLPYRVENMLSLPLQQVATQISCAALVCLGQPALAEGNTILIGDHLLAVEEACSGLRIFMGIIALAFAYIIVFQRVWWGRLLLLMCTLPIAVIANSTRIVVTGLLWQNVSGEVAHKFSHDLAGWFMIPFAACMFGIVLWYLDRLFPIVERATMRSVVRSGGQLRESTGGTQLGITKG